MLPAWDQGHSWPHLSLLRDFCFRPESHFNLVFFAGSLCSYHLLALEPLIIAQSHCKIVHPHCTNYCWSHPQLFALHGSEAVKSSLVPIVKPGTRPLIANLTMYTIMGSNFPIHLQNPWVWAICLWDREIRTKSVPFIHPISSKVNQTLCFHGNDPAHCRWNILHCICSSLEGTNFVTVCMLTI